MSWIIFLGPQKLPRRCAYLYKLKINQNFTCIQLNCAFIIVGFVSWLW